jgi:quercetin dioxygenase-like cupin family protein
MSLEPLGCETHPNSAAMRATRTGERMSPSSTDLIQVGALGVRFVVEPGDSDGSVSVFECVVPADSNMPVPHSHDAFEETIYGLEGTTSWTVDGQVIEIPQGEGICIRRGVVHGFENHGTEDARFLAVASPGVMRPDYFHEIHDVLAETPGARPDRAKLIEVMLRHGLTPAPPA